MDTKILTLSEAIRTVLSEKSEDMATAFVNAMGYNRSKTLFPDMMDLEDFETDPKFKKTILKVINANSKGQDKHIILFKDNTMAEFDVDGDQAELVYFGLTRNIK